MVGLRRWSCREVLLCFFATGCVGFSQIAEHSALEGDALEAWDSRNSSCIESVFWFKKHASKARKERRFFSPKKKRIRMHTHA